MNRRKFSTIALGAIASAFGVARAKPNGDGIVGIGKRVEALSLELDKDVEFIKTAKQRIEEAFPQDLYTIGLRDGKAFVESKKAV